MSDYYQTLGVGRNASESEIKQAYRRLASQHHPDKGGDTRKFQEIEEAYRVLSDPEAKGQYDSPQPQFNSGVGGGHPFEDIFRHFGGNPFGDIFGARHHFHQTPRNRTLNIQTAISLEDAYSGKELLASMTLPDGKENIVNVKIPPGIHDGTVLRLAEMGEDNVPGAPRGDLHLTVNIQPHAHFVRQGDDLIKEITLPVWDAILGKKLTVVSIDKKQLEVTIPPGTQLDQILSVQGAGMPNMNDPRFKGRMLLKLKFTVPSNLTEQQKETIRSVIA
jgi:molecular chaperone DnaJ